MATVIPAEVSLFGEEEIRNSPATRRRRVLLGLRLTPLVTWHVDLCAQCAQKVGELTALTGRVIPPEAPAVCGMPLYAAGDVEEVCLRANGHKGMHEDSTHRLWFVVRHE